MGSSMEPSPPRLGGVLETSLYVADLERARAFYQRVFGLEVFFQDGRMCALGVAPGQVLLLFRRGTTDAPAPVPGGKRDTQLKKTRIIRRDDLLIK